MEIIWYHRHRKYLRWLLKPNNNDKTDCNFLASFYPHPRHHLLHLFPYQNNQQSYHNAYLFQNKAESFIQSHASNYGTSTPFFLYYSMQLIHSPISAPDIYVSRCHASTVDDDYKADTERQYCALNVMLGNCCHGYDHDSPCYILFVTYPICSQILLLITTYFACFAVTLLCFFTFLHVFSSLFRRSGSKFDLFSEQLWLQR